MDHHPKGLVPLSQCARAIQVSICFSAHSNNRWPVGNTDLGHITSSLAVAHLSWAVTCTSCTPQAT